MVSNSESGSNSSDMRSSLSAFSADCNSDKLSLMSEPSSFSLSENL